MKGFLLFLLILTYNIGYNQVFTIDNCYIVSMQGLNKSSLDFNEEAFNSYISKLKTPIEILEQKVEGHVFVNMVIKNNIITETSLMIGLNSIIDSGLVNYLKKTDISWIGSEPLDPIQRIVISIKVNYRFCSLENISKSNLTQLSSNNEINQKLIKQFKNSYNNFDAIYFIDSANFQYYKNSVPKNITKKINADLKKLNWYKPEYFEKEILLDFDKNKIINVILQQNDSVFIIENNKLIFSEQGHLKYIRRYQNDVTIELENSCNECKKYNKTLSFYHKEQGLYPLSQTVISYCDYPQLLDTISFTKSLLTTTKSTYIRSNPFKINEPYNKCTGLTNEEYSCVLSKTWGNIFGEINKNTKLNVVREFIDINKKKWYFVLANRDDGFFYLGWVSENDVIETVEK